MPFQEAPAPPHGPMTDELRRACERSIHVVTRDGEIYSAGAAAMFLFREISPRLWRFVPRLLGRAPWIWAVEIGYQIVARNRSFFARFILPNEPETPPDNVNE